MSATLPDIVVTSNEFVDINTSANIAVGNPFTIQNKGNYNILVQESVLKPADDSENGVVVTNVYYPNTKADIKAGSIRVWARALGIDATCKINVQPV